MNRPFNSSDQELIIETVCQRINTHSPFQRSKAYRLGIAHGLRSSLFQICACPPYSEGSPEYDAHAAGEEEGRQAARCIRLMGWNVFLDGMAGLPVTDEVQHGA